ncbi:hypothetical protein ACFSDD_21160 [Salipiger marinus]|uniref:hypothetical protein n=1 Tax=Salipiger marinus TaxID=555512 RepID=UPI002CC4402D|nr:hypothetical protein [Salipiger manganoxidans]MEB3417573.1 hypothetical protein [Salipiger manganoxidans]
MQLRPDQSFVERTLILEEALGGMLEAFGFELSHDAQGNRSVTGAFGEPQSLWAMAQDLEGRLA